MRRALSITLLAAVAVVIVRPRSDSPRLVSRLGRLARGLRSGDAHAAFNDPALRELPRFGLTSPVFADGFPMPSPQVNAGARTPSLAWHDLPEETVELALIIEDIDVPFPRPLVHAIAHGIDPGAGRLPAGAVARPGHPEEWEPTIRPGRGAGGEAYLPPTPIPGHGPHRYLFELFALRERARFDRPPGKAAMLRALRRAAIGRAVLIGTHEVR
jgi:phosphatidylethanolamine-binding protein (PEBP) family uncharacterized protein